MSDTAERPSDIVELDRVIIRFAGDSGDGMQLTGDRFTNASALFGNDLATLPDYPAEIRAPAGTLAGVSAFQVHISDHDIPTPGDVPSVLVAMNPAALKAQLGSLDRGGTIIVNTDTFDERNLAKAGYDENPLTDGSLGRLHGLRGADDHLTKDAVAPLGVKPRDAERSKNFFALGLVSWMYTRPEAPTLDWIHSKFGKNPQVAEANRRGLQGRPRFGETAELFGHAYTDQGRPPSSRASYTNITGNTALAWGLIAAGQLAKLPLFLGSYPITPASDILHELSKHKNFGVRTLQAEDEIAGIGAAIGAAFGGHLGITTTSGPGVALKSEAIGLAVSMELPLAHRRRAARRALHRPAHQDRAGRPAAGHVRPPRRVADAHRRRQDAVGLLLRGHRGRPHRAQVPHAGVPALRRLPRQRLRAVAPARRGRPARHHRRRSPPSRTTPRRRHAEVYWPYLRDPETLARPWAVPGTPGLMHRIGGLEKQDGSGNVSYEPANHEHMVRAARRQGRRHRQGHPATWSSRATPTPSCWSSAGAPPGAPSAGRSTGAACAARRWPASTSPTSTPSPRTWATSWPATPRCWCRR